MYLSKKNQDKQAKKKGSRQRCPKCHKCFLRLDTHLKKSTSCRPVDTATIPPAQALSQPVTNPPNPDHEADSSHLHSELPSLPSFPACTPTASPPPEIKAPSPEIKAPLILPSSKEDWEKANTFLKENVVPRSLQATSVEEKNALITDGTYKYFADNHGVRKRSGRGSKQKTTTRQKHDRALKKVKDLKSKARKVFRQAKREGRLGEEVQSLAKNFFNLVRQHNKLKKQSRKSTDAASTKATRKRCHQDFWRFTRELLNDDSASRAPSQFSPDETFNYFVSTYQSTPSTFMRPSWMPSPQLPSVDLETDDFDPEEIEAVIKRTKSSSSPSPFDQIPYLILKKCPALNVALADLFNHCWLTKTIPLAWKTAGIKLLGKTSAIIHPTLPANFRPIALTSCLGKIFTSILRNRWLSYMLENGYLDPRIQKAFTTATPGCTEHHSKLATILSEARKKHKSLAVAWLDLANAYGSVHHSLIQFSLKHYHASARP